MVAVVEPRLQREPVGERQPRPLTRPPSAKRVSGKRAAAAKRNAAPTGKPVARGSKRGGPTRRPPGRGGRGATSGRG
jgi:hypothetical protein